MASATATQSGSNYALSWRQMVTSLYPEALLCTYIVPPVHFNKVPYIRDTVPATGQPLLVLHPQSTGKSRSVPPVSRRPVTPAQYSLWTLEEQPQSRPASVQGSDFQDDFTQRHVLANLQALGRADGEPMFILSQLKFGDYLNQPAFTAAVAASKLPRLPRPSDLTMEGDFDVLIVHRRHGILVAELKSIGRNWVHLNRTQAETEAELANRISKVIIQLNKSETVVKHLVSDIAPGLTVKKSLFLPYVDQVYLQRVLSSDEKLEKALRGCLGAANATETSELCCCSDQLCDPDNYQNVTNTDLTKLRIWWKKRLASAADPLLTDELYLDLVARFVGPATTVSVHCNVPPRLQVRTEGEALAELGRRLASLVLTQQQVDLLNRSPPRIFLTGPPGTGKTLMLVLEGLRWLLQGHDVHVVSVNLRTLGACHVIQHQLQMTLTTDPTASAKAGQVYVHYYFTFDEEELNIVVGKLSAAAKGGSLHIILDEADFTIKKFVSELIKRVSDLHLWAANVKHEDIPPELQPEVLTQPLRCAPVVLREIEPGVKGYADRVYSYSDNGLPSPADGLEMVLLPHAGDSHTGNEPVDCTQCGEMVATSLQRLGVGPRSANSVGQLTYSDVFILTRNTELHDDVKLSGMTSSREAQQLPADAIGLVRGLRAVGLPVCVIELPSSKLCKDEIWKRKISDVATRSSDCVTVAHYDSVSGLERPVVVWLSEWEHGEDEGYEGAEMELDVDDRFLSVSRCTTHLLKVYIPKKN